MTITSLLEREDGDEESVDMRTVMSTGTNQLFDIPIKVLFQGHNRTRNVTMFGGVMFPFAGEYEVKLLVGDKVLDSWAIRVLNPEQPVNPPVAKRNYSVVN
jgi:hypothetical protein